MRTFFIMKKRILLAILSFFLFFVATIYITFPLIFHLKDFANGEYVIAWILNWNIHSILSGNILHIFQANIYYPFHNSLAFSVFLFPSSVISLIPFLFLHEPMVPSNITFFSSLIFLGFFTYILTYYITGNFFASLLSGFLIIFSPATLDKRVHLQILSIEWIPLSVLFFLHFCKTGKFQFFLLCLLFFVIQTYNDFMAGYFLVFCFVILACIRATFLQWKNLFALLITFLVVLPICIPYYQVSKEFHYARDLRESIHFALQPEDLLVTGEYSRLNSFLTFFSNPKQYPANAEIKPGFLGLIFSLLSICTALYLLFGKKKNVLLLAFVTIALLGLTLSFGPALHLGRKTIHHPFLIPLPYALFYYLAPGFQGFRNSARFEMLFILAMPIGIGIMLHELLKKKKHWIIFGVYIFLLLGTIAEFNFPIHFEHAPTFEEFPPVYAWIAQKTSPHAVILETPMYNWDNNPFGDNQEVRREYYSIIHFRNIVGGGSGFSPPPWQRLAKDMFANFPSKQTLARAKKIGVNYIIVHTGEYNILHSEKWKSDGHGVPDGNYVVSQLDQYPGVSFVKQFNNDYVYKIQ